MECGEVHACVENIEASRTRYEHAFSNGESPSDLHCVERFDFEQTRSTFLGAEEVPREYSIEESC